MIENIGEQIMSKIDDKRRSLKMTVSEFAVASEIPFKTNNFIDWCIGWLDLNPSAKVTNMSKMRENMLSICKKIDKMTQRELEEFENKIYTDAPNESIKR